LAPNEGIEIKATGSVHLSLQGKGGGGKSQGTRIPAQYIERKALAVRCIDSDSVNKTLSQYKGLRTAPLPLLREGGIDQRTFDGLMEELLTTDAALVVDNGKGLFVRLSARRHAQWLRPTRRERLRSEHRRVGKRTYFGRVELDGKQFLDMKIFEDNAQKLGPTSRKSDGRGNAVCASKYATLI
jgi:hypothetical protein